MAKLLIILVQAWNINSNNDWNNDVSVHHAEVTGIWWKLTIEKTSHNLYTLAGFYMHQIFLHYTISLGALEIICSSVPRHIWIMKHNKGRNYLYPSSSPYYISVLCQAFFILNYIFSNTIDICTECTIYMWKTIT